MTDTDVDPSVQVEQGPTWLVELMIDPPWWLVALLVAITVAVIGLAALGYRRNGGLDQEVLEEMGQIGTIVFSIIVCAQISSQSFNFGYAVDVIVGSVVGLAIAQFFIWAYYQSNEEQPSAPDAN